MDTMTLKLLVWRQANGNDPGRMVPYTAEHISPDMSFLEMLDVVNERLILDGKEPIALPVASSARQASGTRCSASGFIQRDHSARVVAAVRAAVYFAASHKTFVLQTSRQEFAVNTA